MRASCSSFEERRVDDVEIIPFPDEPAAQAYLVFPARMENNPNVFFHGTEERVLNSIMKQGFRIPPKPKAQSVSFASSCGAALAFACNRRRTSTGQGCIIAVQYDDLTRKGLRVEPGALHDYTLTSPPTIIAVCTVPAGYRHW